MENHASVNPDGSVESNTAATFSSPDLQLEKQAQEPTDRLDEPACSYVKDIQDGEIRVLSLMVHPSDVPAPGQRSKDKEVGAPLPRYHAADQRLVQRLAAVGFRGPEFDLFHEHLVKTGYAVFTSWIMTGKMHKQCARRGRSLPEFPGNTAAQDRRDLATDTAVMGFDLFHRIALVGGKWSPEGGASLMTFYIGAGISTFPNVYRSWLRRHISIETLSSDAIPERGDDGVEAHVTEHLLLEELEKRLPAKMWEAVVMKAQGYTYLEIARKLETTPKAVEGLVQRGRAKADEIREEWGGRCD